MQSITVLPGQQLVPVRAGKIKSKMYFTCNICIDAP
jgi:hypothetical protein